MRRLSLVFILSIHLVAIAAWLCLMPGGFSPGSARFWTNRGVPIVLETAVIFALIAVIARRDRLVLALSLPLGCMWLAAAIAAMGAFPVSGWLIGIRLGPLGFLMLLTLLPYREAFRRWHAVAALAGIVIGTAMVFGERAPLPQTRPLNITPPPIPADVTSSGSTITIGTFGRFTPRSGDVQITCGPLLVELAPLLTFTSCSPDAGWVAFALPGDRKPLRRTLESVGRTGDDAIASYRPQGILKIHPVADNTFDVEAFTPLDRATYSHLNTFAEISVAGHKKLAIAFSACPETKIDVTSFDYPFGRPATFACLDGDGIFRVLRASNSEKGPFTELASGPLGRGRPLSLTLYDRDQPQARITLDDWSAQLSTEASPTAGWKVPANAIEFSLMTDDPRSPAGIYITLAATSVGRGFDSVGHARGTYRNRMHIERLR